MAKKLKVTSSITSAVKEVIAERKDGGGVVARTPEDDVLVSLGDLSGAQMKDITFGKNFETIAIDYITTFNMAIAQGVSPLKALAAMTQATAIVAGNCIRAGLKFEIAVGLIKAMVVHAKKSTSAVRIVTKN